MLLKHQHPDNKSIMLAVLGAPNVGKSTLCNHLLGMDLSVVTHKPQTTRNKFHCVVNIDRTQLVLVDTPGLHRSNREFNKRLNEQAREGSEGADLNLLLIDLTSSVLEQVSAFREIFRRELQETWIVFTKSDLISDLEKLPLSEIMQETKRIMPEITQYFVVSAKEGENIHQLIGAICDKAQTGYHLYPDGEVSNKNERFFVTEYIREQAFLLLNEELPYELAVVVEDFRAPIEEDDGAKGITHVAATILVNRPSQRGIVVGKGGIMIREIGIRSRQKIEEMVGGQVNLNLHVKVSPKWFANNFVLESIGLPRAPDSNRVWRKKS